ncbi:MAG: hypothetical protein ACE5G8_14785 [Anaerolineae bacterium]
MQRQKLLPSILISFFCLAFAVSGCGSDAQKGFKPSPDWSRGVPVGQSVAGSVGLATEGSGERVHLVWPVQAEGERRIRYVQLNRAAAPVINRELALPSGRLRLPRLLAASDGRLHLFWVNRMPDNAQNELWHVVLGTGGELAGPAALLSAPETSVGTYDAAAGSGGGAVVAWDDEQAGGIYLLRLNREGDVQGSPAAISGAGSSPSLRVDSADGVHLAWREGRYFFYSGPASAGGVQVVGVQLGTGDSLVGPEVGLSEGWVYVFWSVLSRLHEQAGTAFSEFVAFPAGAPAMSTPARLPISNLEAPPYSKYTVSAREGEASGASYQLVRPEQAGGAGASSEFVHQPYAVQGERNALAVAVSSRQQLRYNQVVQVAVALFEAGQFKGYQMAAKTESLSRQPVAAADAAGNLYLAWREGAGGDEVFFATTAPESRAVIDRLGGGDVADALLRGGFESIATVALFPLALPLVVPGLVLLFVVALVGGRDSLTGLGPWLLLLVAVGLYQATKFMFLPDALTYVPFSAWIDVPAGWRFPLRIGVPLASLLIGAGVAGWMWRRRTQSMLVFYLLLTLTDVLLTMAVYGVIILGVS